jgi:hypothetical protein
MRYTGAEKSITEPEILAWGLKNGFDLTVVDTSAVYNPYAKRYLRSQASESLLDIIGNYKSLSVWIELKAPKKGAVFYNHRTKSRLLNAKLNNVVLLA